MSDFSVRIANDDLLFSASHFITFDGGACEALHGHDYRVTVEVHGPLNSQQYVVDFTSLHKLTKQIINELDHCVLLPQNNPRLQIRSIGDELEIASDNRRWVLPKQECRLLPIANTTSEALAQYIAQRISEILLSERHAALKHICVELREGNGFTAICGLNNDS